MDTLYATYLGINDSLKTAVTQMKNIQSPVLVVSNREKHFLFTSKVVFQGYHDGLETCSQLKKSKGYEVGNLDQFDIRSKNLPLPNYVTYLSNLFETILDKMKLDYGFLYSGNVMNTPNIVIVITRREDLKTVIVGSNTICVCTGPNRHLIQGQPGLDGKACKTCPPNTYDCTSSV